MTASVLHYIYDPLCGWCYGAAPMIAAVRRAGITLRLHGGGLFPKPTRVGAKAAYMRLADARIGELTGQPFGAPYCDRLLDDQATQFWSVPPIAGVLAAEQVQPGATLDMLAAIQHAHYVEGQRVAERETLTGIASEIGLDATIFDRAFSMHAAGEHVTQTHGLMRRVGIQGYPGFVLENDGRFARLAHEAFYGRPADFADSVIHALQMSA